MRKVFYILISITLFFSCDKVDCPNEIGCVEPKVNTSCVSEILGYDTCKLSGSLTIHLSDTIDYKRALIEELTGYKCNNCPKGAAEVGNLLGIFGDTLVAISIHSGSFAVPGEDQGDEYITDFRTDIGDELTSLYQVFGYPNGIVNKKKFDDAYTQGISNWRTSIQSEVDNSPTEVPQLNITSHYSSETSILFVSSNIKYNTSEDHSLMFLLVEDNIIDVQKDGTTYVPNYTHRHVLRASLTKALLGSVISSTDLTIGTDMNSDYFAIDPSWNIENCEVIAILYNTSTQEAAQVQKVHVK